MQEESSVMKMEELSQEQTEYLKGRGFEMVLSSPPQNEQYPYLTLRKPGEWAEDSSIRYHYNDSSHAALYGLIHPTIHDKDILVSIIEEVVSECKTMDGKLFTTTPGKSIKIFVLDDAWKEVAQELVSKYGR